MAVHEGGRVAGAGAGAHEPGLVPLDAADCAAVWDLVGGDDEAGLGDGGDEPSAWLQRVEP